MGGRGRVTTRRAGEGGGKRETGGGGAKIELCREERGGGGGRGWGGKMGPVKRIGQKNNTRDERGKTDAKRRLQKDQCKKTNAKRRLQKDQCKKTNAKRLMQELIRKDSPHSVSRFCICRICCPSPPWLDTLLLLKFCRATSGPVTTR